MSACWDCPACGGPVTVWADRSDGVTVNFRCDNAACKAGKAPWDTPEPGLPWPNIERDVPVTPALARRFVPRNWSFGYNGHSIYQLGRDLYAVTWDREHNPVITGRIIGANTQSTADLIAFLSEWEG